jgi:hypothetical protein
MNGYREFWNNLIFGSKYLFDFSLERYWTTTIVFFALCLLIGIASMRLRLLAVAATSVIFIAYAVALVPFMVWSASCTGCGASFSYDTARSYELEALHMLWGGFFATGIAAIWLGVLLSQGAHAIMARRPPAAPSAPPRTGEGLGRG